MKWTIPKNNHVFRSKVVFYTLTSMLCLIWGHLSYLITGDLLSGEFVARILWGEWVVYSFLLAYSLIIAYMIKPTFNAKIHLKKVQKEAISELMRAVKIKRDLGI